MKKIRLLILLLAFAQTAFAQSSKIPEVVKAAFAKAYPNAKDVDWEHENGNFEAEFEMDGDKEMSAVYDAWGALLETEMEISFSALPKAAREILKGKKVREVAQITSAKGVVTYEAEVRRKDLLFDADGKPMK